MIMTGNPYDGDDHLPAGRCSIIHCYDVLILATVVDPHRINISHVVAGRSTRSVLQSICKLKSSKLTLIGHPGEAVESLVHQTAVVQQSIPTQQRLRTHRMWQLRLQKMCIQLK